MQPASPRNWRVRRAYDRVQPVSSRCSRPGLRSSAGTGRRTPTRRCAARRLGTRNSPGGRNPPRRNGTPDTRSFANAAHRPAPRTADRQGSRQPRDIGPRRGGSGDLLRIVRSARKVVGLPRQDSERPAPIAGAGRRVVWVRRRRLPPAGRNRGTGPGCDAPYRRRPSFGHGRLPGCGRASPAVSPSSGSCRGSGGSVGLLDTAGSSPVEVPSGGFVSGRDRLFIREVESAAVGPSVDTGQVGDEQDRQRANAWSPGQAILNDTGAREPEHTFHQPVPITARIVWADDGEEHIETVALGWTGRGRVRAHHRHPVPTAGRLARRRQRHPTEGG
jgi:hypothetical protein